MIKTCISVAAVGKAPEIVKHMIDEIGWPISTIVIKPERVNIYVCYKWFQYYKVQIFKKEVKRCEKRYKYYYKPYIYGERFTQETRTCPDKFEEALAEFSYTDAVQGGIRCGDIEAIRNEDRAIIGYKF